MSQGKIKHQEQHGIEKVRKYIYHRAIIFILGLAAISMGIVVALLNISYSFLILHKTVIIAVLLFFIVIVTILMILFHNRAGSELKRHRDHQEEIIHKATSVLRETNRKLNEEIREHQKDRDALEQEFKARVEAEAKQLEAVKQVERSARLASIGVMAAGITHEINQPLNAIKVTADSIRFWNKRNPGNLPETFTQPLEIISKSVERIVEIIRHMRSFWVVQDTPPVTEVDLNQAVENALSLIRQQLHAHSIRGNVTTTDHPLNIAGNLIHFEQVIVNLLVNAINALDERKGNNKSIELTTAILSNPERARLVITDNGPGLPEGIGDKIFDPFFSTGNEGEGMGLGLAIVKRYVDRYDGTIKAFNIQNNGTPGGARFVLEFPIPEKKTAAVSNEAEGSAA